MNELQMWLVIVLSPVAVYGFARVIFAAYFRARAEFLRRYFSEHNQGQDRS